jgi:hypothetical protein
MLFLWVGFKARSAQNQGRRQTQEASAEETVRIIRE